MQRFTRALQEVCFWHEIQVICQQVYYTNDDHAVHLILRFMCRPSVAGQQAVLHQQVLQNMTRQRR